ncbi:MAG: cytochrome c oxidase accessory protein CcoG [Rhodoferax sp.]|jgi:cytochrome c oxidase accessory protein FixG|nr:cytochrome c oxidase accessory protein CcoG [Rhodoferax sp.]MBP6492666.1 cytochrome c oxidase accessory protein CcoG [Rhodoferax sp.]MBP7572384.1 cytochrome c oxidase accessory protein CcoG [Rhodoferax sp.]HPW07328.1 cytochrome c oxidase accessory protein CcoG [Burkholderiaceae bacterium]
MSSEVVTRKVIQIQPVKSGGKDSSEFSLYEKTEKVYPRSVSGQFARLRWVMVWVTQIVFYGLPWLQWNGRQAVLFDLAERRFYVLGLVLHPQDFIYLAVLLIIAALVLFFFTAIAGRLWCGYACPQTVYTEIFLWVERHTEGDRQARMRLDSAPWGVNKMARKVSKQLVWMGIALITGLTFVGYFSSIRGMLSELSNATFSSWEWFWVSFYGLATYGNAGFMREQICKHMCPYARIQSALIDMDSMVIAYDEQRGESRGSRARGADPAALGLGDCIDCTLCVQVCPTGIDIRKGLQNECIACAACIDVCDQVMEKMDYPKGLIRYTSGNGIMQQLSAQQIIKRISRPRVWIYCTLLCLVCSVFTFSLVTRKSFSVDIIKDRGSLAREVGQGEIENVYRMQIMNGLEEKQRFTVSVSGIPNLRISSDAQFEVPAVGIGSLPIRLTLPSEVAALYRGRTLSVVFEVQASAGTGQEIRQEKSAFYVLP